HAPTHTPLPYTTLFRSVFSSPTHPDDIPNALLSAVGFLRAGDILLLELQGLQSGFWVPVEVDPHIALMIRAATLLGIIVIECARSEEHTSELQSLAYLV